MRQVDRRIAVRILEQLAEELLPDRAGRHAHTLTLSRSAQKQKRRTRSTPAVILLSEFLVLLIFKVMLDDLRLPVSAPFKWL
jgi:hypothetical protein